MIKKEKSVRITLFLITAVAVFGLIGFRLFNLAYLDNEYYRGISERRREYRNNPEEFSRGDIYIKSTDGAVLVATTKKYPIIYVSPKTVEDRFETARAITDLLEIDREIVDRALDKENDPYEILIRRASDELAEKVKQSDIKGLGVDYEEDRYYPGGNILSHVLGFVGFSKNGNIKEGQYGVEAFYEDTLVGPKDEDSDIVLTIDRDIQSFAEEVLNNTLKKWDSYSGTILIQDPLNGAILAMASSPSFDPNSYNTSPIKNFLNPAVQNAFEPGSSYKPVTMAMALDLGKVNPSTTYYDAGYRKYDEFTITNYDGKGHGMQTMTQVLEKSLNTGAIYAMDTVGYDSFLNYAVSFRFGEKTGIDLAGEEDGNLNNLEQVPRIKVNYATAAFGQGITVTPIQLVAAYSALANGGKLYKPYIVDTVITHDSQELKTKPEIISAPISKETSQILSSMLVSVVDNGFDKARIEGYDVAGKTGTAQIADATGGYTEDTYIHNFIGFAPASSPRFVIFIKIDRPQGGRFASTTLTESFREMAKFLLNHFNIPPTR